MENAPHQNSFNARIQRQPLPITDYSEKHSGEINNNRTRVTMASETYHNHGQMVEERTGWEDLHRPLCSLNPTHKHDNGRRHSEWQQQRHGTGKVKLGQGGRRCSIDLGSWFSHFRVFVVKWNWGRKKVKCDSVISYLFTKGFYPFVMCQFSSVNNGLISYGHYQRMISSVYAWQSFH